MSRAGLKSVTLRGNYGVAVVYETPRHIFARWESPGGWLTVLEAARLLRTTGPLLRRMAREGRITMRRREGRWMLRVRECVRLRKRWRGGPASSSTAGVK